MPVRLPTTAVLLLIAPAILCQSTPAPQNVAKSTVPADPVAAALSSNTALPQPALAGPDAAAASASRTLFFYTSPRSTVEMAVHTVPATSSERLARLRADFAAVDCGPGRMREQRVADRHDSTGANLLCLWPGKSKGTIVVVAHYEHDGRGEGALDDWSGAVLLPFLYQALQGQPRQNTYVFLECWKAAGADAWFKSLSKEDRKRILAVIDLDGLGLSYTRFFTTFSPFETVPAASTHLQTELLWAALSDGLTQAPEEASPHHWLSVDPTDPFRAMMIPSIIVHSVPPDQSRVPGSAADIASAVDGNAYFTTYHLLCAYLTSLDRVASKLESNDRMWDLSGNLDVAPEQETPIVTFRHFDNGRLAPPPAH
jgi:hypothetical protein